MRSLLEEHARHFHCMADDVGNLHCFTAKIDLAACDSGNVEQIVDQANNVIELPLDHLLLARSAGVTPQLHELKRGHDGRQWVSELVAQHGQKFVFGSARGLQIVQQLGALDLDQIPHHEGVDTGEREAGLRADLIEVVAVGVVERKAWTQAKHREPIRLPRARLLQLRDVDGRRRLGPRSARQACRIHRRCPGRFRFANPTLDDRSHAGIGHLLRGRVWEADCAEQMGVTRQPSSQ